MRTLAGGLGVCLSAHDLFHAEPSRNLAVAAAAAEGAANLHGVTHFWTSPSSAIRSLPSTAIQQGIRDKSTGSRASLHRHVQ